MTARTQPLTAPAQRVLDALDELEETADPRLRALAISQVVADLAHRARRFKALRRRVVLDYRAAKVSYRRIATLLGVSAGTVQDIERGYSGSGRDRPKSTNGKADVLGAG